MSSDPITDLCAVLRGERDVPAGEAAARLAALARRHRGDRLLPDRTVHASRVDALFDELSIREMTSVLNDLEAEGLEPLVLKGMALAHTHYPQSWMRPRLDTDILVAPESHERAFELLRSRGYEEPPVVSGSLVSYQAIFVRRTEVGGEHVIDLHWRIANPQIVAGVSSHAELIARANRVALSGRGSMRVPSSVDALLIACLHRAAHHADADDLIWIYDIHLIATRLEAGQWREFVKEAIDRQVAGISARGLSLAVGRFHTGVPDGVMRRLSAMQEPSVVLLRRDLRPVDRLAIDLTALGLRQRARLLREHLFPPASYVRKKYGVQNSVILPAVYAYRILAGATRWLRR